MRTALVLALAAALVCAVRLGPVLAAHPEKNQRGAAAQQLRVTVAQQVPEPAPEPGAESFLTTVRVWRRRPDCVLAAAHCELSPPACRASRLVCTMHGTTCFGFHSRRCSTVPFFLTRLVCPRCSEVLATAPHTARQAANGRMKVLIQQDSPIPTCRAVGVSCRRQEQPTSCG